MLAITSGETGRLPWMWPWPEGGLTGAKAKPPCGFADKEPGRRSRPGDKQGDAAGGSAASEGKQARVLARESGSAGFPSRQGDPKGAPPPAEGRHRRWLPKRHQKTISASLAVDCGKILIFHCITNGLWHHWSNLCGGDGRRSAMCFAG